MSVAESIVIFAPIDQFGCLSARSGVTPGSSAAGTVRSGPPEAVRIRRRTSSRLWPTSDWWMALCSRVDRQDDHALRRGAGHEELAGEDHRLLVGEPDRLPRLDGGGGGAEPGAAGDGGQDEVGVGVGRHRRRARLAGEDLGAGGRLGPHRRRGGLVGHRHHARPEAADLLEQAGTVPPRRQARHGEPIGEPGHHVERLDADRAGGSQDGDALHGDSLTTPKERRAASPLTGPPGGWRARRSTATRRGGRRSDPAARRDRG